MTNMSEPPAGGPDQDSADLAALFPDKEVTVNGETFSIHPFFFGQLSTVTKFVKPIAQALLLSGMLKIEPPDATGLVKFRLDDNFVAGLFEAIEDVGDPLMKLIAYASGKDRAWLDTVPVDEGIRLTQKIWEINADFFVKRVMPMLGASLTKLKQTGEMSSQGSFDTGTAGPT
jgi:hypothetical protein